MRDKFQRNTSTSVDAAPISADASIHNVKSSAPRFASFRPRRKAPAGASLPGDRSEKTYKNESKTSSSSSSSSFHQTLEQKGQTSSQTRNRISSSKTDRHTLGEEDEHAQSKPVPKPLSSRSAPYYLDTKADDQNLRYGTLHRHTVAKYQEAGRGRVLGLAQHFQTAPASDRGYRLVADRRSDYDQRDTRLSLKSSSEPLLPVPVVPVVDNDGSKHLSRDYVPISLSHGQKRRGLQSVDVPLAVEIASSQQYEETELDSSVASDTEREPLVPPTTQGPMERNVELSGFVRSHPADVDGWLALIRHQDEVAKYDIVRQNQKPTKAQLRGLADVRLSMYEKALSNTTSQVGRSRLVHGMMNEGARVWDSEKLAKRWDSVVKAYPNDLQLRINHIDFEMTNSTNFCYSQCQEKLRDCIDVIKALSSSTETEDMESFIFLRLTTFMVEAGFSEHAHALWQAIFESSFFEPHRRLTETSWPSFAAFWDSEVPRFGEDGARGPNVAQEAKPVAQADPAPTTPRTSSRALRWSTRERQNILASVLPARSIDSVDENDPYRIVLFSDIQSFLFCPTTPEGKWKLLERFLRFCGLPPIHMRNMGANLPSKDSFLGNVFLENGFVNLGSWLVPEMSSPFRFPVSCFVVDTVTLLANKEHWFDPWADSLHALADTPRGQWIINCVRQLLPHFTGEDVFTEYLISLEERLSSSRAQKHVKRLLKAQPSVRLYNAYAVHQHRAGRAHEAEHIWSTTLSMQASLPRKNHHDSMLVWLCWIWTLLDSREFSKALRLMLAIPSETISSNDLSQAGESYLEQHGTSRLRTRQYLTTRLDQSLLAEDPEVSIHYLDLLALFDYLAAGRTLAAAIPHYTVVATHYTIEHSPLTQCLVHQCRARLLHLHAQSSASGFRPADILVPLAESRRLFPNNTIFLSLHQLYARRSGIFMDRLRTTDALSEFSKNKSHAPNFRPSRDKESSSLKNCIIPALFDIWTELARPKYAGTTAHSIRAVFEKHLAAESNDKMLGYDEETTNDSPSAACHSPLVWKLYI